MSATELNVGRILVLHPSVEGVPEADQALDVEILLRIRITQANRSSDLLREGQTDLVVFDLSAMYGPWRDALRDLRRSAGRTPILVIYDPERHSELELLGLGVDALLPKATGPAERMAVLEALLRRAAALDTATRLDADITVDFGQRTLRRGDRIARLTPRECEVLKQLLAARGRVIPRGELASRLFGPEQGTGHRALDVVISRLRAKLETELGAVDVIRTAHGIGYVLASSEATAEDLGAERRVVEDLQDVGLVGPEAPVLAD